MSSPYLSPLLRRGPGHTLYSTIKPVIRIRSHLAELRKKPETKNEYSSILCTIPKILQHDQNFKKMLMAWEAAKEELHSTFVHNTTCINCSSAPWKDMPWRHKSSSRLDEQLAKLKQDMEDFSVWKDMNWTRDEVQSFCVRWAELEDLYLRETQKRTECVGLVGPTNPEMRLRW